MHHLASWLNVLHRREVRSHALERLEHHPRDILRPQPFLGQRRQEQLEARVLRPVAVREGDLHNRRVLVDDPAFLPGNAAGLLGAERSPVKTALRAHDADLLRAAFADAMRADQLDGALGRLRTGREQEYLVQAFGGQLHKLLHQRGAFLAGKHVVVHQAAVDLVDDGLAHFGRPVAGVGHQHAAAPVQPAIAVFVIDENILGAVPNQRRLAAHGLRLELAQLFQRRQRVRDAATVAMRRYLVSTRGTARGVMLNSLPIIQGTDEHGSAPMKRRKWNPVIQIAFR